MSSSPSRHTVRKPRLSTALKIGLLFLVLDAAVLCGKAFATNDAARENAAIGVSMPSAATSKGSKMECRETTISLDEGYGLQGQKTEVVCAKAL